MRTIMMGLVLAAMSGCATMGRVGPITNNYRVWWRDCGVSRDVPSNIEVFHGSIQSPTTALVTMEQMPGLRSNVKGVTRVIIPFGDKCPGGVMVADLYKEAEPITPAAVGDAKVYKVRVVEVPPERWSE